MYERMHNSTDRQTGIEILRIISMLMIVTGHSIIHGGYEDFPATINGLFAVAMTQGARIGVDIFVMITGFYSVGREVRREKIKKQYIQIWLYSVIITGLLMVFEETVFGWKTLINAVVPLSSTQYWFATCYILLLIISPILQNAVQNLGRKQYREILILLFLLWSVMPQLHLGSSGYSNFAWFIFIYLLSAYWRVYTPKWMNKVKIWHGLLALCIVCLLAVYTYKLGLDMNLIFLTNNAIYLYGEMNMIPAIITATLLFIGFYNWNVKSNKNINRIAECTFGVYLFHDNPNIREFIWEKVFGCNRFINNNFFLPYIFISIILVYSMGTIIEMLRQLVARKMKDYVYIKSKEKNIKFFMGKE